MFPKSKQSETHIRYVKIKSQLGELFVTMHKKATSKDVINLNQVTRHISDLVNI